jgi:hypothetical protein
MKKMKMAAVLMCGAILLSGCSQKQSLKDQGKYQLPESATMYNNYYDSDFGEMTIENAGRLYTLFGWRSETVPEKSISECIGYVDHNEDRRIYLLSDDPDHNYLVVSNLNSIRGDWCFYRAQDTVGKDIYTPDFIEPNGFEIWGSSGCHSSDKKEPAKVAIKINCDDIKSVNCYVAVNHKAAFTTTASLSSGKLIRKGDFVYMEITEEQLRDRIPEDEPFNINVTFKVVDANGDEKEVYGYFTHDMMFGSYLYYLEIYQETNYYLNTCI